jgi:hypothetical protein
MALLGPEFDGRRVLGHLDSGSPTVEGALFLQPPGQPRPLAVLPVTVAYLYLQRYLISGIATGATKG